MLKESSLITFIKEVVKQKPSKSFVALINSDQVDAYKLAGKKMRLLSSLTFSPDLHSTEDKFTVYTDLFDNLAPSRQRSKGEILRRKLQKIANEIIKSGQQLIPAETALSQEDSENIRKIIEDWLITSSFTAADAKYIKYWPLGKATKNYSPVLRFESDKYDCFAEIDDDQLIFDKKDVTVKQILQWLKDNGAKKVRTTREDRAKAYRSFSPYD